jgi:hypothetical protein
VMRLEPKAPKKTTHARARNPQVRQSSPPPHLPLAAPSPRTGTAPPRSRSSAYKPAPSTGSPTATPSRSDLHGPPTARVWPSLQTTTEITRSASWTPTAQGSCNSSTRTSTTSTRSGLQTGATSPSVTMPPHNPYIYITSTEHPPLLSLTEAPGDDSGGSWTRQ